MNPLQADPDEIVEQDSARPFDSDEVVETAFSDQPRSVLDEQSGKTLEVPGWFHPGLVGDAMRKAFHPEEEDVSDVGRTLLRNALRVPEGIGELTRMFGDHIADENRPDWVHIPGVLSRKRTDWEKDMETRLGKAVIEQGDLMVNTWKDMQQSLVIGGIEWTKANPEIWKNSIIKNPSFTRWAGVIISSVTSLGLAYMVSKVARNPWAGGAALGILDGAMQRGEARAAGKDVGTQDAVFLLTALGTTVLETLPLNEFLKGGKGKIAAGVKGALSEGWTETAQQFWQNAVAKYGYEPTRKFTDGMLEALVAGVVSGGVLGGFSSASASRVDNAIAKLKTLGATDKDIEKMGYNAAVHLAENSKSLDEAFGKMLAQRASEVTTLNEVMATPSVEVKGSEAAKADAVDFQKTVEDAGGEFLGVTKGFTKKDGTVVADLVQFRTPEGTTLALKATDFTPENVAAKLAGKEVTASEETVTEQGKPAPLPKEQEELIKGRVKNLSDQQNNILDKIDLLDEQIKMRQKDGKPTEALEKKISKLVEEYDLADIEMGDLLTTSGVELKNEEVTLPAKTIKRLEAEATKEAYRKGVKDEKEINKIKTEYSRIVKSISVLSRRKIDPGYKTQVNAILSQFDLKFRSASEMKSRENLKKFIEQQREEGEVILIPDDVLRRVEQTTLGDLTLEDLRGLHALVKQLVHIGALKGKLIAAKSARDLAQTVTEISEAIYANTGAKRTEVSDMPETPSMRETSILKRAREVIQGWWAAHRKVEFLAWGMDGHQRGEVTKRIIEPIIQTASDEEMNANAEDVTEVREAAKALDLGDFFTGKRITLQPTLYKKPISFTGEELMGVYVNSLHADNLARLTDGWNFSSEDIAKLVAALTPEEKAFADKMLKLVEKRFGGTAEVFGKLTGEVLGKVEGIYWPIVEDKELDEQRLYKEAEQDLFAYIPMKFGVEKGFTMGREGGKAPVELRAMRVLINHITKINHFNTHALRVRDVQKILRNPIVRQAMTDAYNKSMYEQFPTWLQNVANPKAAHAAMMRFANVERVAKWLRKNATVATLGLKVTTSTINLVAYSQVAGEIGPGAVLNGVREFIASPKEVIDFIYEKSPAMKYRSQTLDREIVDFLESHQAATIVQGKKDLTDVSFAMFRFMDRLAVLPAWYGAYLKNFGETHNEEGAVLFADAVIRRTQASGMVKDLPAILTGSEFQRLFTMFYTQMSTVHNQINSEMDRLKFSADHPLRKFGHFTNAMFWYVFFAPVLEQLLRSGGKASLGDYLRNVATYPMSGMILLRDIANSFSYGKNIRDVTSPAFRGPTELGKAATDALEGEFGKAFGHAFRASGYIIGMPTEQIYTTFSGLIDLLNGESGDLRRLLISKYALNEA